MADQDGVRRLAEESACWVLARHDEPSWLQLFVRVAYAYEEMTAHLQPAQSRAFFAQSNPEVLVRLLSAWLSNQPDLSNPGLQEALAELQQHLSAAPEQPTETASSPSMDQLLDGALTSAELSERLAVTRQAINQRRSRGQLLALKQGREFLYPPWQFQSDGSVLLGLPAVLSAMASQTAREQADFLLRVHPDLDGQSPLEWLRQGRTAGVLALL